MKLIMAICLVTGKSVQFGNNVSKSKRRVKKIFKANLQTVTLFSKYLGKCRLTISPRGLSEIEKKGGLDSFLNCASVVYGDKGKDLVLRYKKTVEKREKESAVK